MTNLVNKWRESAAVLDHKMNCLVNGRWYSVMNEQEKTRYEIMNATFLALRQCAYDLERELTSVKPPPIMNVPTDPSSA